MGILTETRWKLTKNVCFRWEHVCLLERKYGASSHASRQDSIHGFFFFFFLSPTFERDNIYKLWRAFLGKPFGNFQLQKTWKVLSCDTKNNSFWCSFSIFDFCVAMVLVVATLKFEDWLSSNHNAIIIDRQ